MNQIKFDKQTCPAAYFSLSNLRTVHSHTLTLIGQTLCNSIYVMIYTVNLLFHLYQFKLIHYPKVAFSFSKGGGTITRVPFTFIVESFVSVSVQCLYRSDTWWCIFVFQIHNFEIWCRTTLVLVWPRRKNLHQTFSSNGPWLQESGLVQGPGTRIGLKGLFSIQKQ